MSQNQRPRRLESVQVRPNDVALTGSVCAFDFESTFHAHFRGITRVVARLIGDPSRAEELAVEAFWRLWRHRAAHGPLAVGWVRTVAIRLALDELRRRTRRGRYAHWLSALSSPMPSPHEALTAADEQSRVRCVLAGMRPRDATLLLLASEDLAYGELAAMLSLNPRSVGTQLRRARARFERDYRKRHGQPS